MDSLHKYLQIEDPARRFLFALENKHLLKLVVSDDEILNLQMQLYGIDFSTFQIGSFCGVIEWKPNINHKLINKKFIIRDFITLLDKISSITTSYKEKHVIT